MAVAAAAASFSFSTKNCLFPFLGVFYNGTRIRVDMALLGQRGRTPEADTTTSYVRSQTVKQAIKMVDCRYHSLSYWTHRHASHSDLRSASANVQAYVCESPNRSVGLQVFATLPNRNELREREREREANERY